MVEAGPPAELLAQGGKYAELWARQQAHVDEVYDSGAEELLDEESGAAGAAGGAAAAPAAAAAAAGGGRASPAARGGAGLGGDLPSGTS